MEIPYAAANILGQREQGNSTTGREKPTYTTTKKVLKTTSVLGKTKSLTSGSFFTGYKILTVDAILF